MLIILAIMAKPLDIMLQDLYAAIEAGDFAKLKAKDRRGNSVLHRAALGGHVNFVNQLLTKFPNLKNDENNDGACALHCAAQAGSVELYKLLLDAGLSSTSMTKRGFTPLHIAARFDHAGVVKYILQTTPELAELNSFDGSCALHSCASGKETDCYDLLVEHGISPDILTLDGRNVQHVAARCGNLKLVKHILDANPGMKDYQDGNGCTALHAGAVSGNVELYKYLIQKGLSHETAPHNGRTVLHIAARRDRLELANYIIQTHPALLHMTDCEGNTAMHHAAMFGNVKIYDVLLEAGLSPKTLTQYGKTTGDIAAMNNHTLFLKHMIETDQKSNDNLPSTKLVTLDKTYIDRYLDAIVNSKDLKARNIRLTVVGHERTGKTSLCKHMLEENIPEGGPGSTDGIDIYIQRFVINMVTKLRSKLEEGTEHETSIHRIRDIVHTFERKLNLSESDSSLEETVTKTSDGEMSSVKSTCSPAASTEDSGYSSVNLDHNNSAAFNQSGRNTENSLEDMDETELVEKFRMIPEEHHHDVERVLRSMSDEAESVEEKCYVSVWDFGGEKDFYNTHHIFLTSDAVYLLVFNLFDCLSSDVALDRIVFWLQSISTYSTDETTLPGNGIPPVILVGTHLDLLEGTAEEITQTRQDIYRRLTDIPEADKVIKRHVRAFLTLSNKNLEDGVLSQLWDNILASAQYQSQWERQLPGSWLALERVLMKKKSQGAKVQTFRDICEMNWNLEASINSEEEIFVFLKYLDLTRNIIVCSDENCEVAIIILDPQWLTHAFRHLITSPKFQNHCQIDGRLGILWPGYEKTAKLSMELVDLAWSRDKDKGFMTHRDTLLNVMERFGLIAQPLQGDLLEENPTGESQSTGLSYKYIVPCMLPAADPEVIMPVLQQENTVKTCTLCFVAKNDFVQFSIFDKVIASCIQRFQPFEDIPCGISACIQRGFVCLSITPVWNMILCCKDRVMKVTLFKFATSDYIQDGAGFNIRVILQDLLHKVLEMTHQEHLQFDIFLHCDFKVCNKETRVRASDLMTEGQLPCTSSEIQSKMFLNKKDYNVWFVNPKDSQVMAEEDDLDVPLGSEILDRKPTEKEMARISRYIGASYFLFLVELGLSSVCIEQIRISYASYDLPSQILQMLFKWANMPPLRPTIRNIFLAMKNNGMNYQDLIDNRVFVR